jgi:hypothetical protein
MAEKRKPKSTERIGRIPQGRHDSQGVANSWKLSTFVANTAGRCAVCGESFPIGTNVQMWRDTKKRVHPRCSDGTARLPRASSVQLKPEEKIGAHLSKRTTSQGSRPQAEFYVTEDDRLIIVADRLPTNIRKVIGRTRCPVCDVERGTPCKGMGTTQVHKYRFNHYVPSYGGD